MISNVRDQPHGASFKRWASLVTSTFANRGIEVTTKHSYAIDYKYVWACTNDDCATEYARHSKSIDPAKHTCGKCRGRLVQIRPAPRNGTKLAGAGNATKKEASAYQTFVKNEFAAVKRELELVGGGEKSPMKDVMKEIGIRYRSQQQQKQQQALDTGGRGDKENDVQVIEIEDDETFDGKSDIDSIARKLDFLSLTNVDA